MVVPVLVVGIALARATRQRSLVSLGQCLTDFTPLALC